MKFYMLPKGEIKKDERFMTGTFNEDIVEHVRKYGLVNPLSVWKANGYFILVDGYSRLEGVKGEVPVKVVEGDFIDAMKVRCVENMLPHVRSFAELGRIFKMIDEETGNLQRAAQIILPAIGLEPSVNLASILKKVGELDSALLGALERKKSPLRVYEYALRLPTSLHSLLAEAVEKFNLSLSRIRIACERLIEIVNREGERECYEFLQTAVKTISSGCMFEHALEKRARPLLYSVLEKVEKIDLMLKEEGPIKLRWDRTFERDEVFLEIKVSFSDRSGLKLISSEKVKDFVNRAVDLIRKGIQ